LTWKFHIVYMVFQKT